MIRQFLCQGPHETAGERRLLLKTRINALAVSLGELDDDNNDGAIPLINKLDELEQQLEALSEMPDDHGLGRIRCGADLTDQIAAIPADGDVYTYQCTSCGNTGTARKYPSE